MISYGYNNDMHPSAGGLPPADAAKETLENGLHHLSESSELCLLENVLGGLLVSAGGTLSLVLANGFPTLSDSNPGFSEPVTGLTFPIGLIILYWIRGGAVRELTKWRGVLINTGHPMWLSMTTLSRQGRPIQSLRAIVISLTGNFLGALSWASMQAYFTETVTKQPWRSRIIEQIKENITDQQWHVIFLRAVGRGFLVTFAMVLGTQQKDGVSKALGLHLLFFISCACHFPYK